MVVIGITGEKAWEAFARSCQIFFKLALKNIDNLNSFCKKQMEQEDNHAL
jgi:hypothetical protein